MVLQQLDYLAFLDIYHERIRAFHVKDAEFNPGGRSGVYGGYQNWIDRPGRFRSSVTARSTSAASSASWRNTTTRAGRSWSGSAASSILKTEPEGAPFIRDHIIRVTEHAFDDFAGGRLPRN